LLNTDKGAVGLILALELASLTLPKTVKIHPVVNVSRIRRYVGQVEGQRREQPAPVIIEGEEECVKYRAEQDGVGRSGVELLRNGWGLTTN